MANVKTTTLTMETTGISFEEELAKKVTELIGFYLGAEHIHSINEDGSGYHFYIQALKPGYPLLAMHYRGALMLVLPFEDHRQLKTGEVMVQEYIDSSHWNYGYYWGGGVLIGGSYWQPLEEGTGIHDTARISRYLRILLCRTHKRSSGYGPKAESCAACTLDETACPFSPCNQTGSWGNEVQEPDQRSSLYQAINTRLQEELGLKSCGGVAPHDYDENELWVFPGYQPYSVQFSVHRELLNDLLYHPEAEQDFTKMARDFKIFLSIPFYPEQSIALPRRHPDLRTFCLDFWGDRMLKETSAAAIEKATQEPAVGSVTPAADLRGLEKFVSGGLFGRCGLFKRRKR